MKSRLSIVTLITIFAIITSSCGPSPAKITRTKVTNTPTRTRTPPASPTPTRTPTETPTLAETLTETPSPTEALAPTITLTPSLTPIPVIPHPDAPLCPDSGEAHDTGLFHTLWDSTRGCHYDHEHGVSPFTGQVANTFPGFDLFALLGNVQVGHTNPSSEMENTTKHGGMKWNVQLHHPQTCQGFEGAETGVDGSVIQFHGFGDYEIEGEPRTHSTVALLRQCRSTNPTDYGYVFYNQLQDYGQRISPYQGTVLPYPNQPVPPFPSPDGPYLSIPCIDLTSPFDAHCRAGLAQAQANSADSIWTSKPTLNGHSDTPDLFQFLWRVTNIYKMIHMDNWPNASYPFDFIWLCTSDGGATYEPEGCRFNNTTTQGHEIKGRIPAEWDNLAGWDSDNRPDRITAQGFLNSDGEINSACSEPGAECYPVKLVNAFTGTYGSVLVFTDGKGTNVVPINPDRNIFFCGESVCSPDSPGAVASGWVGSGN